MPVPNLTASEKFVLAQLAAEAHDLQRIRDIRKETSQSFVGPLPLRRSTISAAWSNAVVETTERNDRLAQIQASVDEIARKAYGFDERTELALFQEGTPQVDLVEEEAAEAVPLEDGGLSRASAGLISFALGCVVGRWDIRVSLKPTLTATFQGPFDPLPICAPAALVDSDGIPAQSGKIVSEEWLKARPSAICAPNENVLQRSTISNMEYPLRVNWDGIVVDDEEHEDDIVLRTRDVFELVCESQGDNSIEREACEVLGVRSLRDYFRRPAEFFAHHLAGYSKSRRQAPIYWPISTASGSYTLWLYYHRLTANTLDTAVNRYLLPKIERVQREINVLTAQLEGSAGRDATRRRDEIERWHRFLNELVDLRDELLRVVALPYRPNLDDGVIINAAPLHKLFRHRTWARDTSAVWEKLERGEYDWAHLAYQV